MYRIQVFNPNGKLNHTIKRRDWRALTARIAYGKAIRENPERIVELQFTSSENFDWITLLTEGRLN